ncbi:hypothetical protein [Phaeobacter gallaeciensis]|uniref:Uncharacterized protein n=1 Tax=Phaeobacter gallaeciensis TaxID=60890 RepID=A0AAC9ZF62_9RHOB|nr:hypothetical protein [Phaeobacter gallaeciensis]AHD12115.1 hypothetical protein Gal_04411 [Phaeobacter gallaeciensis DSM 26640]ATE95299.1 hypothetical protein PhaeoP11_04315 [Phaeobacter gallaeciensis]ATE99689.1 hypothetical protein PhaeoP73_04430 [Phaeobacter gallaeciensis]ATF04003.1 hypothetical protein PhaeoP75_04404 [Phaeobacter gallaeciensis]ATF08279.1 hypothetical protein PhaeoP63_04249 [Phaeobacter gallaeciensis]
MNKVTHESLTQGPPAPVAPTSASIGAAALAAQDQRKAQATTSGEAAKAREDSRDGDQTPAADATSDIPMESTTTSTDTDPTSPTTTSSPARDSTSGPATLAPADLDQLAAHLRSGPQPLGTRSDLIELHKRITGMFATLNEGLGEMYTQKAEADRKALSARMDALEEAVNRMEGALRIELEPVLRDSFAKVLAKDTAARRRSLRQRLQRGITKGGGLALILALGLAAGTLYHSRIATASGTVWSAAQIQWASFVAFLETTTADPSQPLNNTSE